MLKCILCTSEKERYQALKSFILNVSKSEVIFSQYKEDVIKNLSKTIIDVIIIDLPFVGDHHEIDFVLSLHQRYPNICIVLLVAHKYILPIQEKIEGLGIFIVSKPIQKDIFKQFLSFIKSYQCHMQKYQSQQKKLLKQIAEIKQFNLAKCLCGACSRFCPSQAPGDSCSTRSAPAPDSYNF